MVLWLSGRHQAASPVVVPAPRRPAGWSVLRPGSERAKHWKPSNLGLAQSWPLSSIQDVGMHIVAVCGDTQLT